MRWRRGAAALVLMIGSAPAWSAVTPTAAAGFAHGKAFDFDGDGVGDLAVGVPGENLQAGGFGAGAGAAHVLYGTLRGLTSARSQFWSQDSPGVAGVAHDALGPDNFDGEAFGWALASGDFDGDGYADLAVGVRNDEMWSGSVNVLYGSRTGLTAARNILLPGRAEALYGFSLAAGDFDGDGRDDLAVGAPDGTDPPGEESQSGGFVDVVYGSPTGLTTTRRQTWSEDTPGIPGETESGPVGVSPDEFGRRVVAGDVSGDGVADLVVTNPHDAATYLLLGTAHAGLTAQGVQLWDEASAGVPMGGAVALGDFDRDGHADLATSGPGTAGSVTVLYGTTSGLGTARRQAWSQDSNAVPGSSMTGDGFGAALAASDVDGDGAADLAVGIPGKDVAGVRDAGAVVVLPGGPGGLKGSGSTFWSQNTPGVPGVPEPGDGFGSYLRGGDLGHSRAGDLAVGVDREDVGAWADAGAVNVLYGSRAGLSASGAQMWDQDAKGIAGRAEPADHFGFL